jgi:2'-5' RNA ligase
MARLFFAIWPQPEAREALARLAHDVARVAGGKPVEAAKIHLTLAFLGPVDDAGSALAHAIGGRVGGTAFALALDRVGSFRRARVAWAGPSALPPALESLESSLTRALRAAGFALEERPFNPHVTLARKAGAALPRASIEPIAMRCDALALVASEGGRYVTLESWPLAAAE